MLFLLLSILSSTILVVIMKLYARFGIDTFQAIVFNYFTCVLSGWVAFGEFPIPIATLTQEPWFPYTLVLGIFFIGGFTIVGFTVQRFGMTVASVMQKMSMLMAVFFTIVTYHESLSVLKMFGIALAIAAIFFSNYSNEPTTETSPKQSLVLWLLPILTLLTSGVIDTLLYYIQRTVSPSCNTVHLISTIFGIAACLGTLGLSFQLLTKKATFAWKNVLGGIALGIPNFGSMYFLVKTFTQGWEGSVVFPINNVGIIALSSLIAFAFLKEKITLYKLIGVILAGVSIAVIALS